jgi:diguanylate cyclase (GGDEF)-like protein/PAS domain S-box-containing protein
MPWEHDFRAIVESLHDGLYFVDRDRRITFWNKAAERITGYSAREVMGRPCSDNILMHVDPWGTQLCLSLCPLAATMGDGVSRVAEVYLRHKDGQRVPVSVRTTAMRNEAGEIEGCIELFTDLSSGEALRLQLEEMKRLALLDHLTQLPNRRCLESKLEAHLTEIKSSQATLGLLYLDIDHFKAFNDRYGHDAGDQVLRSVANTLKGAVRPFDTVGRWGGEEFLGLFPNADYHRLRGIAERLRMLVEHSRVDTPHGPLGTTVSLGGVIATPQDEATSLLTRADSLMYLSKQGGRNRIAVEDRSTVHSRI